MTRRFHRPRLAVRTPTRSRVRSAWILFLLCQSTCGQQRPLKITVLQGSDAVLAPGEEIDVRIRVSDAKGAPVEGAAVTFAFPDGSATASATTDAEGVASAEGLSAGAAPGLFSIEVTTSRSGRSASAVIHFTSIQSKAHMPDPQDLQSVREHFQQHKQELIRRYRAEGAGIGKAVQQGGYAIVVYVKRKEDVPPEPVELDTIPIRFEVTGGFELQEPTRR